VTSFFTFHSCEIFFDFESFFLPLSGQFLEDEGDGDRLSSALRGGEGKVEEGGGINSFAFLCCFFLPLPGHFPEEDGDGDRLAPHNLRNSFDFNSFFFNSDQFLEDDGDEDRLWLDL